MARTMFYVFLAGNVANCQHVVPTRWCWLIFPDVATCLQMLCCFDPLADTTFSYVGDMTKDMSPTRHTMSDEGLGRHNTIWHSLLRCVSYLSTNQHTFMTVEGTDHFRLDLTLLIYRMYLITFYCGQSHMGVGGPPRGSRHWDLFYAGRPQKKLRAKVQISNGLQQDRGWESLIPSHTDVVAPRPTLEFHPLESGNQYMSRRYGMTQTNVRAVSLAEFQFTLILASSSCVVSPTQRWIFNFHVLALSYGRQLSSLTCQHGIIPSPNTLPLNGTRGLRVHRRLAAAFVDYPHAWGWGCLQWYCQLRATAPINYQ